MKWIPTEEKNPPFGEMVMVYCRIYGRFLAVYEKIGDFQGVEYGNWRDIKTEKLGILPPTHWYPLLDAPNESNTK